MAGGRPSKYETFVKPRLKEVEQWVKAGASHKEIALALGIHTSTFSEYLNKYPEFKEAVEAFKGTGIAEVKLALLRSACGYEYEEVKTCIKKGEDGKSYQYKEITKKHKEPNPNSIAMYLRNYADDFYDTDKMSQKFKEMELELRKEMVENNNW